MVKKHTEATKRKISQSLIRHGAIAYIRSGLLVSCKCCLMGKVGRCKCYKDGSEKPCPVLLKLHDKTVKSIMALSHITDADVYLVNEFAKNVVFLELVDNYVSIVSPLRVSQGGEVLPRDILKLRWVVSNSLVRLSSVLGINPEARKRLNLTAKTGDLLSAMKQVDND